MKITAAVTIVPIQIALDLPDSTPAGKIRDLVIEQARHLIANNGSEHVILAADMPELVDGIPYLNDLGFPVLVEQVIIEPPEPDWSELAEFGCLRSDGRSPDDDPYFVGFGDWPD